MGGTTYFGAQLIPILAPSQRDGLPPYLIGICPAPLPQRRFIRMESGNTFVSQ